MWILANPCAPAVIAAGSPTGNIMSQDSSDPVFKLDYTIEREDLLTFEECFWSRSRFVVVIVHVAFIVLLISFGLFVPFLMQQVIVGLGQNWPAPANLLYLVGAAASVFFGYQQVNARYGGLMQSGILRPKDFGFDESHALGKRQLSVSSNGIQLAGASGENSAEWTSVDSIHVTDSAIYIVATVCFIIPRHSLENQSDFDTFTGAIRRWHSSARLTQSTS